MDPVVKKLAIDANQKTWKLLANEAREPEDSIAMIAAAYASLHLWDGIGTDLHRARAHWLLSRTHVVTGNSSLAQKHAELCAQYTSQAADLVKDFDKAYAIEALARAFALSGRKEEAATLHAKAAALGEGIADKEDQEIFVGDFKAEPWFGIS